MEPSLHIVCPHCDTINRVPRAKLEKFGSGGRCGQCRDALFDGHPVALDTARFERHLAKSGIPLLIDLWAPMPLDPSVPRDRRTLRVVGMLAPGATVKSADAELQPIAATQARDYARTNQGWAAHVVTTKESIADSSTWVILGLLGAELGVTLLAAYRFSMGKGLIPGSITLALFLLEIVLKLIQGTIPGLLWWVAYFAIIMGLINGIRGAWAMRTMQHPGDVVEAFE